MSAQNVEKRLQFATEHVSLLPEYWDTVIFSDEVKTMLYYHDGQQRAWRKPLTALENKSPFPTVKLGNIFVMVWGCISSNKVYLDILKNKLIDSIKKFGFIDLVNPIKFY